MSRLLVGLVVAVALCAGAGTARADDRARKDPFAKLRDPAAIRALPPAKLKDPFARPAPSAAVLRLSKAKLKNPFGTTDIRPDELPPAALKDPFAR